jgi:hypothetical protein
MEEITEIKTEIGETDMRRSLPFVQNITMAHRT